MMLAGFESATSGEIFLDDELINNTPPHKRGLGMVFQNYALFPHMTVADNVAFPLRVRGIGKSEAAERVRKALDMVRMGSFEGRKPAQLSGGQQQRVAVARALAGSPSILLADEPTGNLDSKNGEAVMHLLADLHREGSTICMVTHDPRFAKHAQREVHLFDGKVVSEDELKKLTEEVEA
jgi:ABC-type Fe3+/spermidine/putrescine transport system ATPase subunit